MDYFLKYWKIIVPVGSFLILVLGNIINFMASHKIANNHLSHIDTKLDNIQETQKEQGNAITGVKLDIAYIKGVKEKEDKVIKLLENTLKN